jgi:hypothetical protein
VVAGIGALVLAAHVVVALSHGGPVAVPDVPSYLSVAQWVAGGLEPPPFGYHPGYGLLLAPLALTGLSPDGLHTAALMVNGLLAAGAVVLAAGLARALAPEGPRWVPVAAALAAAVHPAFSSASRVAWTETLLGVLVLSSAWLVVRATRTGSPAVYAALGLVSTIGASAHPRMAALGVAAALAVAVTRPGWRNAAGFAGGAATGIALTLLALAVAYTGPAGGGRLAGAVESAGEGAGIFTTVAGQLAAVAASTAGLAVIGLVEAVRRSLGVLRWREPVHGLERDRLATAVLVGAGAVATTLIAGASLAGSDRADTFAYGRYLDPYTIALVVVALATLAMLNSDVIATSFVVVLAATALVWLSADLVARPGTRVMVMGTDLWWRLSEGALIPALLAGSAVALMGLVGWLAAARWPDMATSVLAFAGLVALASTVTSHLHLASVGEVSAGQATASAVVRDLGDAAPACLAHDTTSVPSYVMWLYRMQLPATVHERVDLSGGGTPCSPLVVAHERESVVAECPDALLLADEPMGSWALYEVPAGTCTATT